MNLNGYHYCTHVTPCTATLLKLSSALSNAPALFPVLNAFEVIVCNIKMHHLILLEDNFVTFFAKFYILFVLKCAARNLCRVVRKPVFRLCENKDADQLRGNHEADQRLCFDT